MKLIKRLLDKLRRRKVKMRSIAFVEHVSSQQIPLLVGSANIKLRSGELINYTIQRDEEIKDVKYCDIDADFYSDKMYLEKYTTVDRVFTREKNMLENFKDGGSVILKFPEHKTMSINSDDIVHITIMERPYGHAKVEIPSFKKEIVVFDGNLSDEEVDRLAKEEANKRG